MSSPPFDEIRGGVSFLPQLSQLWGSSGARPAGTKQWSAVALEFVTVAVGIGGFALPGKVGTCGIAAYAAIFVLISYLNFQACLFFDKHKNMWNAKSKERPDLDLGEIGSYEEWGKAAFGPVGFWAQRVIQLGYYALVIVVFAMLLDQSILAVLKQDDTMTKSFKYSDANFTKFLNEKGTLKLKPCGPEEEPHGELFWQGDLPKTMVCDGTKFEKADLGSIEKVGEKWSWTSNVGFMKDVTEDDLVKAGIRVKLGKSTVVYKLHKDHIFEYGESTVWKKIVSKVLTVALQLGLSLFYREVDQCFPLKAGFFGTLGVAGVVMSWLMIVVNVCQRILARQKEEEVSWHFWHPASSGTEGKLEHKVSAWAGTAATAFCAWAMLGLVPGISKEMAQPRDFRKALSWACVGIFSIYLLPIWIYWSVGDGKNIFDLLEFKEDDPTQSIMAWILRLGVICNMISSFPATLHPVAQEIEKMAAARFGSPEPGSPETKPPFLIRSCVRCAFCLLAFSIAFTIGGTFDQFLTVIAAIFMPLSVGILPFLFDLRLKWKIDNIDGKKQSFWASAVSRFTEGTILSKVSLVVLTIGVIVSLATIPLGVRTGVNEIIKNSLLTGLSKYSKADEVATMDAAI